MSWSDLVSQLTSLGFEDDFLNAIQQECPSPEVIDCLIRYAEKNSAASRVRYLEGLNDKLKDQCIYLQIDVKNHKDQLKACREKIAKLKEANLDLTQSVGKLEEKVQQDQKELEELRRRLDEAQSSQMLVRKYSEENAYLAEKLQKIKDSESFAISQNELLQAQLSTANKDLQSIFIKLMDLEKENIQLKTTMSPDANTVTSSAILTPSPSVDLNFQSTSKMGNYPVCSGSLAKRCRYQVSAAPTPLPSMPDQIKYQTPLSYQHQTINQQSRPATAINLSSCHNQRVLPNVQVPQPFVQFNPASPIGSIVTTVQHISSQSSPSSTPIVFRYNPQMP